MLSRQVHVFKPKKIPIFLSAKHNYITEVIKYFILHNMHARADISALLQCAERVLPLKYSHSYWETHMFHGDCKHSYVRQLPDSQSNRFPSVERDSLSCHTKVINILHKGISD